ncbi:GntR family transcriptional regulator [Mesorhizobium sp. YIM 152430]|jgi:GntR family transcriptional regulator|uniref:GntR family transcriptional regulator n=1 Tax=Mesorhizobium sp. YIM 152430 TaxID=3031761 RepID=UPI0023DB0143|nr:GntR family transcriptional regulator [Mesorhizobium sp. YIM 152430]MDF1598914.1 GntR family transcriptional regulator [Mesorhizobium sp. YIM 152430]
MQDAPLYLRIADELEAEIVSGALATGSKIKSERALSEKLGVSRMTARQALQHLLAKGLVETRTGQGTFVGTPRIEQRLETLSGFSDEMARQGRRVSSVVIASDTRHPDEPSARALSIAVTRKVHRLARVRFADGVPVALETTDICASRAPGLLEIADFGKASLYRILTSHFSIVPTTAAQTLTAGLADHATARTLQTDIGSPVLKLTRLTRDQNGDAFEFVRSTYRGDYFVMKVDLSLGASISA